MHLLNLFEALLSSIPPGDCGVRSPQSLLSDPERCSRSGSLCAEAGQGLPPFPAPLSPLVASFLRCARDRFLLTKPITSCTIEVPASLCSDGVRDHPGMPFGIIPDLAFGLAGIPTRGDGLPSELVSRTN
jgi:hypothetical protein